MYVYRFYQSVQPYQAISPKPCMLAAGSCTFACVESKPNSRLLNMPSILFAKKGRTNLRALFDTVHVTVVVFEVVHAPLCISLGILHAT